MKVAAPMFSAFLEAVFLAIPITAAATIAGAFIGGYFFGATPALVGAGVGLIGGGILEFWVNQRAWANARHKWLGIAIFCAILGVIAVGALLTQ